MLITKSARPQRIGSTPLEVTPPPLVGKSRAMTASTNLCASSLHKCRQSDLLLRRNMISWDFSGLVALKSELFL
jgi:hypothetical protein